MKIPKNTFKNKKFQKLIDSIYLYKKKYSIKNKNKYKNKIKFA